MVERSNLKNTEKANIIFKHIDKAITVASYQEKRTRKAIMDAIREIEEKEKSAPELQE